MPPSSHSFTLLHLLIFFFSFFFYFLILLLLVHSFSFSSSCTLFFFFLLLLLLLLHDGGGGIERRRAVRQAQHGLSKRGAGRKDQRILQEAANRAKYRQIAINAAALFTKKDMAEFQKLSEKQT